MTTLRRRFDASPFRTKLLLYAAFVGTVSLVLVSTAFLVQGSLTFRRSFAEANHGKAEILVRTCASAVGFRDPDFANRVLAGLSASPEVTTAAIYLDDGSLLAQYRRQDAGGQVPAAPPPIGAQFVAGHFQTTMPVTFQGMEVGTFFLRSELPDLTSRMGQFGVLILVVAVLSLGISLWLARSFQRLLMRPVSELQATASRVTREHDYTARARKFNEDELGGLTDAFNTMLARIEERETDLRESEERFSGLLDRLGEAVFRITIPDNICEYCSPAARTVFGYGAAEFLKRPGILLDIVHPDYRDFMAQEHRRLATGNAATAWEYKILDPDGRERWIMQTNSFEYDDFGRVKALEGCCTDVTQRRRAAAEKRRLEIELEQAHKLEALGTLAGGIAHDFNNILEAILGYTDLAAMDLPKDHPVQDFLGQVTRAGRRAAGMVRKILTFSRRTDLGKAPLQLSPVVAEALDLVRPSLPANVTVETDLPETREKALADANQIHQIVMNLCTNASHAMEEGGGTLFVGVGQVRLPVGHAELTEEMSPGTYLQLTISDTGQGIDPAVRERVFEPFFTTKPPGKGTGMGLSMVYGIVLDHGGNIVLESEPGAGTTVRILLPVAPAEQATEIAPDELPAGGSARVLFVDDEEMLVSLVKRVLESLGYEVTGFSDARQALAAFRAAPTEFDIVVTDLTMPNLDGRELAREMLALRPNLPVIICTGHAPDSAREDTESLGIYAFAQKPLTVDQIGKLIHRALATTRQPARDR